MQVSIIGASGYGGGELARLLATHPRVEVVQVVSETFKGRPLSDSFPGLSGTRAGRLTCDGHDAPVRGGTVFLAQESGYAVRVAQGLLAEERRVIDLSADFRLRDPEAHRAYYRSEPAPESLRKVAVYGMPELDREPIRGAQLVANPGCYVTASTLALAPLVRSGIVEREGMVIDAKSGVSGAGRSKSDTLFRYAEANENVRAYGVGGVHRHTPEIEQNLGAIVTFTPHLIPMTRGILATCYARLGEGIAPKRVRATLVEAYAAEPFVFVRPDGEWPATKDVVGSNQCHIACTVDPRTRTVIVAAVIDNLVKGAAGQAIQNMNLMCGFAETDGLEGGGLWP
ncbi:MAG: N-acetyl-gamma-glutamyl-phosphate reductase [Armatimonadota bacterium]